MSIKKQAEKVRRAGHSNSKQDSMLAHISPEEAGMLKMMGGSGRKDPKTGMPHFEEGGGGDIAGAADMGGLGDWGGSYSDLFGGDVGNFGGAAFGLEGGTVGDAAAFGNMSDFGFNDFSGMNADAAYSAPEGWDENGISGTLKGYYNSKIGKALSTALGLVNPFAGQVNNLVGLGAKSSTNPAAAGKGFADIAIGAMFGLPGMAVDKGLQAMTGWSPSQAVSNSFSGITANRGLSNADMASKPGDGMDNLLSAGLGLGGLLYQNSQNNKGLNQQMGDLQSMYGQDSPYAQVLRQQLERRDAASGRRSQYGPREVELQAALAGVNSRNAPLLAQLNQQKMQQRQQLLNSLGYGFQQLGGINGLRDLFSGFSAQSGLDLGGSFGGDVSGLSTGGGLSGFSTPEFDLSGLFGG